MPTLTRRGALAGLAAAAALPATPLRALPVGATAPEWDIAEWVHGEPLRLGDLRGQVVVIDFFQLWCPACKSFSIPTTLQWEKDFAQEIADDRMKIVSIHTVFEGHRHQSLSRLKKFVKATGFGHSVGHDRHDVSDEYPNTMILYGTRGTPEVAIIDKEGLIAYQRIGFFDVEEKTQMIRDLMAA